MDRLHAGMLLQASGRTEALRTLIRAEQDRGPDFLRLVKRPDPPSTPGAARKRDCSTGCCWQRRDEQSYPLIKVRESAAQEYPATSRGDEEVRRWTRGTRVVTPRKEVREGRSFNPDEFAIALDQVVDGKAPADYQDPEQFFSRTYFTQSLTEHTGTVLRRLSGQTESAAPVLSLITQFGGGKTHTLTSLYHIARAGKGSQPI